MTKPAFVLCLDWCDTSVGINSWDHADKHMLSPAGREHMIGLRAKYLPLLEAGTITMAQYEHWMEETVDIYTTDGIDRQTLVRAFEPVDIKPGLRELLTFARERRIPVAVVSVTSADFIEVVAGRAGVLPLIDEIYALRFTYNEGRITGAQKDTVVHGHTKRDRALRFAQRHGVAPDKIIAAGDSNNDKDLAGEHGHLIGIAANESKAAKIRPNFDEVHVSHTLHPVLESVRRIVG